MTKIEQWQEWAKQRKDLQEKLGHTDLKFFVSEDDIHQSGYIKYDADRDRIIIQTYSRDFDISVYGGKELLSVLKQLYEQDKPEMGNFTYMGRLLTDYHCSNCCGTELKGEYGYFTCANCGKMPLEKLERNGF